MCGENFSSPASPEIGGGSSPRVRGKPQAWQTLNRLSGLIPACAGKTCESLSARTRRWAHPRVCGENAHRHAGNDRTWGSSPRVRGKQTLQGLPGQIARLIPACAGKTPGTNFFIASSPAHPRVCGENLTRRAVCRGNMGSSPRVRGKLCGHFLGSFGAGLIPACAGKTRRPRRRQTPPAAHPRVCGENSIVTLVIESTKGSSPRVRGKPGRKHPKPHPGRLIPACAGKTFFGETFKKQLGAHPRVCGENASDSSTSQK